jgi:glucans biosynthesis protein
MNRRDFVRCTAALAAAGLPPLAALAASPSATRHVGATEPFDYARLKGRARALAAAPWQPPSPRAVPESLKTLDWDRYQAIQPNPARALWARDNLPFRANFFHLGLNYQEPVHIYELSGGTATEIAYDPTLFDYGKSGIVGGSLPADLGFAGFRVFYRNDFKRDIVAFLGASYFRAVGSEMQYGLSARGLAIDTGMGRPEEFPRFTHFWLERPSASSQRAVLTVYALLGSPSVAGAYRFDIAPGENTVMDVDAALYPRKEIERLGIAPLTSMYHYGENDRRMADDWRPEVHDSDGLSMWTGAGEWIWRPVLNPPALRFNAYADDQPHGFGLMQRDRNFDHYQDDGVFYEQRPSLWVEPKGRWGRGSVQLVEIPTRDETFDNIVAFWNPAEKPHPGEEQLFSYRLHWGSKPPFGPSLARVVATRTGMGGIVGRPREHFAWRFVVDFAGANLAALPRNTRVEPVITVSRGTIEIPAARPLASIRGYRASFDVRPPETGTEPIDLRLFLRSGSRTLSETWLYQWTPPADRRLYPA